MRPKRLCRILLRLFRLTVSAFVSLSTFLSNQQCNDDNDETKNWWFERVVLLSCWVELRVFGVVRGSKCVFPERSFTALRMTISVSDAGYKNVTREHGAGSLVWDVYLCGLHFCNPQTVGRVVGGWVMGCIFVTRECLSFVVFVKDVWVTFL